MSVAEILNYTYDDYANWKGEWELIGGVPVSMAPAPMRVHQNVATELLYALRASMDTAECPECFLSYENDWKISDDTVLRPDIVLVCDDESEAYLTKAPKIIIEVLSPSTAKKDETVKYDIYESEGVQYYILVYPDDLKAKVFTLRDGRYIKVADFTHEKMVFDDIECEISLDFGAAFRRFRKL